MPESKSISNEVADVFIDFDQREPYNKAFDISEKSTMAETRQHAIIDQAMQEHKKRLDQQH